MLFQERSWRWTRECARTLHAPSCFLRANRQNIFTLALFARRCTIHSRTYILPYCLLTCGCQNKTKTPPSTTTSAESIPSHAPQNDGTMVGPRWVFRQTGSRTEDDGSQFTLQQVVASRCPPGTSLVSLVSCATWDGRRPTGRFRTASVDVLPCVYTSCDRPRRRRCLCRRHRHHRVWMPNRRFRVGRARRNESGADSPADPHLSGTARRPTETEQRRQVSRIYALRTN